MDPIAKQSGKGRINKAGNSSAILIYIPADISNDSRCKLKDKDKVSITLYENGNILVKKKYKRNKKE